MKAEDIEGYRGKEDLDSILQFIDGQKPDMNKKKKSASSSEKQEDKKNKKNTKKESKEDLHREERKKKKEKSQEKELRQKKNSFDKSEKSSEPGSDDTGSDVRTDGKGHKADIITGVLAKKDDGLGLIQDNVSVDLCVGNSLKYF